ncbi:PHA2 [Candida pseudojiufengensis]|uniref:PHA2 n=1 Tax=Candida pseudojiufengensis TaxID=497109 RepID=UPI002224B13C|nr:PHA2 [Candida pseudojiufengensis]KAI5960436.1 PHA2 [Candida pseudojiufengensis]
MTLKIAFLGPEGTYTHQAVLQQFGNEIEISPQNTIGECFDSINAKHVDYAVVPFENSTNGQVVFTYDLLRDWFLVKKSNFKIVAEQFVSIHHNLLCNGPIEKINTIYSHPQVWTQVSKFLSTFPNKINRIDTDSTSKAAELVARGESSSAAISSLMSSKLYNLNIVKENIEDNSNNTTRFLVLGYEKPPVYDRETNDIITSIMLTLPHDDPGALCDVLISRGKIQIMSTGEDLISSLYPPPPPYYKFFTDDNLEKLNEWKKEDKEGTPPGELRFLIPPKQPEGSQYRGYGNIWSFQDKLPNLKDTQWQQLYNDENLTSVTKIEELHKIMDSLLLAFLELISILSVDPQQFEPKIKDMSLLLINFNHLLNTYRPHQSRESLIMLLRNQISNKNNEIQEIDKVCDDIKTKIRNLFDKQTEDLDMEEIEDISKPDVNVNKTDIIDQLLKT